MKLQPGARLGAYEVIGPLGAGGMGEVYRARDTRLGRDVAIKIVPESFANDPERRVRFEREARTLAALNHPHIAQIYGVEESGATPGLVMELVDGATLDELIASGLPAKDALALAKQIAGAVAAAHDLGIIHRDLKPSNVKVRGDGAVKVLDFGLAKLQPDDPLGTSGGPMNSPTITSPATQLGVILGTAAYMAPEQAKGKALDRRADVWAFGAVLYEMLTGRRAFPGEDITDTLAAIITREPDWSVLPADTPPSIRKLLRRCLDKDRSRRLSDLGDARLEIEDALASPEGDVRAAAPLTPVRSRWPVLALVALIAAASAALGAWFARLWSTVPPQVALHYTIALPEGQRLVGAAKWLGLSPDGNDLVIATSGGLFRRPATSADVTRIPGTEKFDSPFYPVFSPDGRSIAFWSPLEGAIRVIGVDGGPSTVVAKGRTGGMSWDADGLLLSQGKTVSRVNVSTGESRNLFTLPEGETALHPRLIAPDAVLFTHLNGDPQEASSQRSIVVQRLSTGARTTVVAAGADGIYVPTGHVLYVHTGTLYAIPFDLAQLASSGPTVALMSGIRTVGNVVPSAQFAVSPTGTLAYLPGPMTEAGAPLELARFEPTGKITVINVPSGPYQTPRIGPDDAHYAVAHDDGRDAHVWIGELSGKTSIRQLTNGGRNRLPVWSADGERIAFQSDREGDAGIFWQRADGAGTVERLTRADPGTSHRPEAWSPKNEHLLFTILKSGQSSLHVLSLANRQVTPFGGVTSAAPIGATLSPDGRWVAYGVVVPGGSLTSALFVQPFPATGALYQLSRSEDGHHPVWSRDGKRLVYIPGPQRLASVTITTAPRFAFTRPELLPPAGLMGPPLMPRNFDIFRDGTFLGLMPAGRTQQPGPPPQVHVVLNWFDELRARMNAK